MSGRFWSVALARRVAHPAQRVHDAVAVPPGLIFPLFFFTAFAGGLSRVDNIPGFDFPNGYTAFQFVFVLLQSAAFGGVFTGFGDRPGLRDTGSRGGCFSPRRTGAGSSPATRSPALGRWAVTAASLTAVAFAVRDEGRRRRGRPRSALYALGADREPHGTLWAAGVAMRLRTMQAGPVMQMPVFLVLFFAPVYVPLALLDGWIHAVGVVNPADASARDRPRA